MHHISIIPEIIFHIGDFAITNTLLTSWLVVILLVILALFISKAITKNKSSVPGKLQNATEAALETFIDFMTTIAGSRKIAITFLPIVATVFFFVLLSNWLGLLPGIGSIGFYEHDHGEEIFVPIFRSVNSDLNMTLALALIVMTVTHVVGLATIGAKEHASKYLRFKNPIEFFVGALEIIGEFAKILSFSFRLFGNVFAGEVLLAIITFLIPYLVPVPFLGLEVFVGLIQALIFSVLTMLFLSAATISHSHEKSH